LGTTRFLSTERSRRGKKLGRTRAVEVLDRTLTEEKNAEKTLTELAERALSEKAAANA